MVRGLVLTVLATGAVALAGVTVGAASASATTALTEQQLKEGLWSTAVSARLEAGSEGAPPTLGETLDANLKLIENQILAEAYVIKLEHAGGSLTEAEKSQFAEESAEVIKLLGGQIREPGQVKLLEPVADKLAGDIEDAVAFAKLIEADLLAPCPSEACLPGSALNDKKVIHELQAAMRVVARSFLEGVSGQQPGQFDPIALDAAPLSYDAYPTLDATYTELLESPAMKKPVAQIYGSIDGTPVAPASGASVIELSEETENGEIEQQVESGEAEEETLQEYIEEAGGTVHVDAEASRQIIEAWMAQNDEKEKAKQAVKDAEKATEKGELDRNNVGDEAGVTGKDEEKTFTESDDPKEISSSSEKLGLDEDDAKALGGARAAEEAAKDAERGAAEGAEVAEDAVKLADPYMAATLISQGPEIIMNLINLIEGGGEPVMEMLEQIKEMIEELTKTVEAGFEGVNARLESLTQTLAEDTALLNDANAHIGVLANDMAQLQEKINGLQADVFEIAKTQREETLVSDLDADIGYSERAPGEEPIPVPQFEQAAGAFYAWGTFDPFDNLSELPSRDWATEPSQVSEQLGSETTTTALDFNLDYLFSNIGAHNWGDGAKLTSQPANPSVWSDGANAFAQLVSETPGYATQPLLNEAGKLVQVIAPLPAELEQLSKAGPEFVKACEQPKSKVSCAQEEAEEDHVEELKNREQEQLAGYNVLGVHTGSAVFNHSFLNYVQQGHSFFQRAESEENYFLAHQDPGKAEGENNCSNCTLGKAPSTLDEVGTPYIHLWSQPKEPADPAEQAPDTNDLTPFVSTSAGTRSSEISEEKHLRTPDKINECVTEAPNHEELEVDEEEASSWVHEKGNYPVHLDSNLQWLGWYDATDQGYLEAKNPATGKEEPIRDFGESELENPYREKTNEYLQQLLGDTNPLLDPLPNVFANAWHLGLGWVSTCYAERAKLSDGYDALNYQLNWYWHDRATKKMTKVLTLEMRTPQINGLEFYLRGLSCGGDTEAPLAPRFADMWRLRPNKEFAYECARGEQNYFADSQVGPFFEGAFAIGLAEQEQRAGGPAGSVQAFEELEPPLTGSRGEAYYGHCVSALEVAHEGKPLVWGLQGYEEENAGGGITNITNPESAEPVKGWHVCVEVGGGETKAAREEATKEVHEEVDEALRGLRRESYAAVAPAEQPGLSAANQNLRQSVAGLNGARSLLDDYVELGLPYSVAQDPELERFLDGSGHLLDDAPGSFEIFNYFHREVAEEEAAAEKAEGPGVKVTNPVSAGGALEARMNSGVEAFATQLHDDIEAVGPTQQIAAGDPLLRGTEARLELMQFALAPEQAPTITKEPVSTTVVEPGEATFIAEAAGDPTAEVLWEFSTGEGKGWSADLTDTGSTTDTLTVAGVMALENGYMYRARFKNSVGSTTTVVVLLEVKRAEAPHVTAGPTASPNPAIEPETVTITTKASGEPAPTVQWEVSSGGGALFVVDTADSGYTTDTLSIPATAHAHSGYEYRARFENGVGGPAYSNPVTLTVHQETKPTIPTGGQPTAQTVVEPASATFTATASGEPAPSVQWEVAKGASKPFTPDTTDTVTAAGALNIEHTTSAESGYEYRARFENRAGYVLTSAAKLTVEDVKLAVEAVQKVCVVLSAVTSKCTPSAAEYTKSEVPFEPVSCSGARTLCEYPIVASYKIEFTNTGNVPLVLSDLEDPNCQNLGVPASPLAAEKSEYVSCERTILPDGTYSDEASVVGTSATGQGAAVKVKSNTLIAYGREATPTVLSETTGTVGQRSAPVAAEVNTYGADVISCKFEYGTSTPSHSTPCEELPSSGTSSVKAEVKGLAPNTTYHFRLSVSSRSGSAKGGEVEFKTTTEAPPRAETESASSVGQRTASLSASVNPEGSEVTSCKFEYGTSTLSLSAPCTPKAVGSGVSAVAASAQLKGLLPGTTYHFRISATTLSGTAKGAVAAFQTAQEFAPSVVTEAATQLGQTTAALNATVNPNGGEVSACKFEYGTGTLSEITPCSTTPSAVTSSVAVSAEAKGLTPDATYSFRIVLTTRSGTSKGAELSFQTAPAVPPSVATGSASEVKQRSATLNATVNPHGAEVTSCKLEYGETPTEGPPSTWSSAPCSTNPGAGTTPVAVSARVTGLRPGGIYSFRILAKTAGGPSLGGEKGFQALPELAPTVLTVAGLYQFGNEITLEAFVNPQGESIAACKFEYGTTALSSSAPCTPPTLGPETASLAVEARVSGLTANTLYHFRISAGGASGSAKGEEVYFCTGVCPPGAKTEAATQIGQRTAQLNATVNPNDENVTSCKFAYSGPGVASGASVGCSAPPGSGTSPVPVSAEVKGLTPGQSYSFEAVATTASGTTHGAVVKLTTRPATAPTVGVASASAITSISATLKATVNPNGAEVTACKFEYGTSTSYGTVLPCTPTPGAGVGAAAVSATLGGLKAATTYHYRVLASSASGTTQGSDTTFKTLPNPLGVATAYVTNLGGGSVTPIDLASGKAGEEIKLGGEPYGIAITPDGKTAYVASFSSSGTVTPIEVAANKAGTPITLGKQLSGIAITPDGKTVYVTNSGGSTVTPIEVATNKAGTPITVGKQPNGIAITPDGKTAYVTNFGSGTVTPIEVATNKAGTPIAVGHEPWGIAITPNGKTAYVTSYNYGSSGTVTPIEVATNKAGAPIGVGGDPTGIAITPDGKTAYVVSEFSGTVTPIEVATNKAGTPIAVGSLPHEIAITSDGKTAYVTNFGSDTVTPIEVATNKAGTPIAVGFEPIGIAIVPAV
jgi:YVTN family beta-propeller protein